MKSSLFGFVISICFILSITAEAQSRKIKRSNESLSVQPSATVNAIPVTASAPTSAAIATGKASGTAAPSTAGYPAEVQAACSQTVLRGDDCLTYQMGEYTKREAAKAEAARKEAEERRQKMMQALQGLGGGGQGGQGQNGQGQNGQNQNGQNQNGSGGNQGAAGGGGGNPSSGAGAPAGAGAPLKKEAPDKKADASSCPKSRTKADVYGLGEQPDPAIDSLPEVSGRGVSYKKGKMYLPGDGVVSKVESSEKKCTFEYRNLKCPSGLSKCTAKITLKNKKCPSSISEGAALTACHALGEYASGEAVLQMGKEGEKFELDEGLTSAYGQGGDRATASSGRH